MLVYILVETVMQNSINLKIHFLYNNINVFNITFDQFNASFFPKKKKCFINPNIWILVQLNK